ALEVNIGQPPSTDAAPPLGQRGSTRSICGRTSGLVYLADSCFSFAKNSAVSQLAQAAGKPKELIWVREIAGRPQIRLGRVVVFMLGLITFSAAVALGMNRFAGAPLRWTGILMFGCGWMAYLILAIELQRQRVLAGRWRFRVSLGALLLMMGAGCAFFALAGGQPR